MGRNKIIIKYLKGGDDIDKNNEYKILDDYAEMYIHSNTHGEIIVKIDIHNVDKCKKYLWCASMHDKQYLYASNRTAGLLHRFIANPNDGEYVDHINRDTLDNREINLRATSPKTNARNTKTQKNNKLGTKGVCLHKPSGKFMAYICCDAKKITLGYFNTIEEAMIARRNAEIKYFGEAIAN